MNKPKKVLIFSHAYFPNWVGGAEIALKEITDRISQNEIEFHLITLGADEPEEKIGNINIHRVRPFGVFTYSKILHKIAKYLFIFQAYFVAKKLHKKHNFNTIWSLMATYGGFTALFFKRKYRNVKFVLTLQEGDPIEYILKRLGVFKSLYKNIFKNADVIQVISNYLGKFAKDMGFNGDPVLIPNAVDLEIFSKEYSKDEINKIRENFVSENQKLLVTTSRLVVKNGLEYVIKALPEIIDYKFLVIGKGELQDSLKNLAKDLGVLDRVILKGYVEQSEISKYLKASDIFIRPSLSEGLGNSFLEAMASGIPVIATPVGGIPDFLIDNETGIFCKTKDEKSIVEAIRKLENSDLRNKITQNAVRIVREKYIWDIIFQKMKCLF